MRTSNRACPTDRRCLPRLQKSHSQPPHRFAFTLIEVLVALSLSLLLISAIYSAISLHWRFEIAGRERIERAQISLAILRLLTEDIGSVAFTPPSGIAPDGTDDTGTASAGSSTASSTSGGTTSGSAASGATAGSTGDTTSTTTSGTTATSGSESQATTSTATPTSLGIVGTAEFLQLDVSRPAREDFVPEKVSMTQTATTLPALSDNIRVTWGMVTPSSPPAESTGVRALVAKPALARQMTDRLRQVVETEEKQDNAPVTMDESSILAKEVVTLTLRYYDGYTWLTEWDSVTQERLPRAIEVTIGFIQPESRKPGTLNLPGSETIVPIKHVIFVPASSPPSGAEI